MLLLTVLFLEFGKNSLIADQIATNYRKANISERQLAMLDFAVKVSRDANEISEEDTQSLTQHGFSEQDVWDIGSIAAFLPFQIDWQTWQISAPMKSFIIWVELN